jgi:DNA-binding response OmpR family regulator
MRIALIEPDSRHAKVLDRQLFAGGHTCQHFTNSNDFFSWIATQTCDLLITDHWAGDLPSDDVIQAARAILPGLPAMVMIHAPRESEIVASLQAGADDCVGKPMRGPELLARIDAVLRRAGVHRPTKSSRERFGNYAFDAARSLARFDDQVVALTPKECRFALLLFANLGRPVSRAHILETVWATRRDTPMRTIDTHASRVRKKLRLYPESGYHLASLYGYGYQLDQFPPKRHPSGARSTDCDENESSIETL